MKRSVSLVHEVIDSQAQSVSAPICGSWTRTASAILTHMAANALTITCCERKLEAKTRKRRFRRLLFAAATMPTNKFLDTTRASKQIHNRNTVVVVVVHYYKIPLQIIYIVFLLANAIKHSRKQRSVKAVLYKRLMSSRDKNR